MYSVGSIFQTTYKSSKVRALSNTLEQKQIKPGSGSRNKEVREQMRLLSGSSNQEARNSRDIEGNKVFATQSKSFVETMQDYNERLRTQRITAKDTSNQLKKLKYSFKSISTKLIRSKTSVAARQVLGEAKREVLRLKRQKQSGMYDSEEIEAAISHAKAIERVAKKKVRHLEEEELAKACGACSDCLEEYQSDLEDEWEEQDTGDEEQDDNISEDDLTDFETGTELSALDEHEYSLPDVGGLYAQTSSYFENMEAMTLELENLTSEMMDEMTEGMKDLLSEMGLDELFDVISDVKQDMDPVALKLMKIKHRTKELKEIAKADAEYLKAVFDHLEKQKGGSTVTLGSSGSSGNSVTFPSAVSIAAPAVAVGVSEPAIDVSL